MDTRVGLPNSIRTLFVAPTLKFSLNKLHIELVLGMTLNYNRLARRVCGAKSAKEDHSGSSAEGAYHYRRRNRECHRNEGASLRRGRARGLLRTARRTVAARSRPEVRRDHAR